MNEAITLGTVVQLAVLLGALSALWYRVETRISKGAVEAMAKAEAAHDKLHAFKLEVAENYAKASLMKDVEGRIVAELHEMRKDFQDAMIKIGASSRGRSKS
jgi:hypothetical protein